jgi:PRTRC genetic system protein B
MSVYALKGKKRPDIKCVLYHAPFFNINASGVVCMGTVDIDFSPNTTLSEFISKWETYFFNSYFSHVAAGAANTTKQNIILLWNDMIESGKPFPEEELKPTIFTIKEIIK